MTPKNLLTATTVVAALATFSVTGFAPSAHAAEAGKVKCDGGNACKGQGGCKSAKNACKGQNGCKGQGWTVEASKAACEQKGGKVGQ